MLLDQIVQAINRGEYTKEEEFMKVIDAIIQEKSMNATFYLAIPYTNIVIEKCNLLILASLRGWARVIEKLLLEPETDKKNASESGDTSLIVACRNWGEYIPRMLLKAGANPNEANLKGETPLIAACRSRNKAIVEVLLKAGANPNGADLRFTPLIIACENGDEDIARMLLTVGADPNNPDPRGSTPLITACLAGEKGIAEMLLRAGADKEKADSSGYTPLIVACGIPVCRNGRKDIVEVLLRAGANPNTVDLRGETPLITACLAGEKDITEMLLRAGADPNNPDQDKKLAEILIDSGAVPSLISENQEDLFGWIASGVGAGKTERKKNAAIAIQKKRREVIISGVKRIASAALTRVGSDSPASLLASDTYLLRFFVSEYVYIPKKTEPETTSHKTCIIC